MYNKRVSTCLGCEVLSPVRLSLPGRTAQGNFYIFDCQRPIIVTAAGLFFFVGLKPVNNDICATHVAFFALLLHLFKNFIAEINGKALHIGVIPLFSCSFLGVRNCQNITFFRVLSACGRCRCLPFQRLASSIHCGVLCCQFVSAPLSMALLYTDEQIL